MEFKSSLHPDKLKLKEGTVDDERHCDGCDDVVYGPRYVCEPCSFVMHKSCCELPSQIQRQALHPHPLRFFDAERQRILCDECGIVWDGMIYSCMQCMFNLDFKCALAFFNDELDKVDRKWKGMKTTIYHFSHRHQLTLCKFYWSVAYNYFSQCAACTQELYDYTLIYSCLPCGFFIHESCVNNMPTQVQSLLHPHHILLPRPLFDRKCYACLKEIEGISFSCSKCRVDLHVSCATYRTRAIKNNFHTHHLLHFGKSINARGSFDPRKNRCVACKGDCTDSSLGCLECSFHIHLECIPIPPVVPHIYHRHPLVLTRPFVEDDSEDYDPLVLTRPFVEDDSGDYDPLVLTRPIVEDDSGDNYCDICVEDDSGDNYCDICETERNSEHDVYYCEECNYIAHIDCVISKAELTRNKLLDHQPTEQNLLLNHQPTEQNFDMDEIEDEMNNIQIHDEKIHPHPLDLVDSSTLFVCDRCGELWRVSSYYRCNQCSFNLDIKCATLNYKLTEDESKKLREIRTTIFHFSHPAHMLTRCTINIVQLMDPKFDYFCNACRQRLYGVVYTCTLCYHHQFILHESCLKDMPMEVESPFHVEHLLFPLPSGVELCQTCLQRIRGIGFGCAECEYNMHVSCAKYATREIKHDSHFDHSLQHLGKRIYVDCFPPCTACGAGCSDTLFGCIECEFYMHLECLRLPSLVKHIRHRHRLTLTKSVVEDDSGEYVCDICETERNPEHDVYYCEECNFIAHIDCVISEVEPPEVFERLVPGLVEKKPEPRSEYPVGWFTRNVKE